MKHAVCSAGGVACLIERAGCAARFLGKGNVSTEGFALILGHPGEPIFRETGVAGAGSGVYANWLPATLRSTKTSVDMSTGVRFSTAARARVRVKRRVRAAVENSRNAVQQLTKALFPYKPIERPQPKPAEVA